MLLCQVILLFILLCQVLDTIIWLLGTVGSIAAFDTVGSNSVSRLIETTVIVPAIICHGSIGF